MIARNFFYYLGGRVHKFFPKLERQLKTANMDKNPEEYLAESIFKSLKITIPVSLGLYVMGMNLSRPGLQLIGILSFPALIVMSTITFAGLPSIKTDRRTDKLEKDLPYALRDILIQIDSGIPLNQAMKTVTEGYGETSNEMERIVKDVDGGKAMVEALEDSIIRNPSESYRRAMWQLTNSMRSGTDISKTLSSVVDAIIKEQKITIQEYGESLNPFILVYLLLAIVGPALGITGLIVMASFTGTVVDIQLYTGILFGLVVVQIFFLNLIKSKRPEVRS